MKKFNTAFLHYLKLWLKGSFALCLLYALATIIVVGINSCNRESYIDKKKLAISKYKNGLKNNAHSLKTFIEKAKAAGVSLTDVSNPANADFEKEAMEVLAPLIANSKTLLQEYGMYDDLAKELHFEKSYDPKILFCGMLLFAVEEDRIRREPKRGFFGFLPLESANAQIEDSSIDGQTLRCFASAFIGISPESYQGLLYNLGEITANGMVTAGKQVVVRAIVKTALKCAGVLVTGFGLLLLVNDVYEFVDCMGWT